MKQLDHDTGGVLIDLDTGTVIGPNVKWCPLMTTTDDPQDVSFWAELHGRPVFVE